MDFFSGKPPIPDDIGSNITKILKNYISNNKELDYDNLVILATFGLILLSSDSDTFKYNMTDVTKSLIADNNLMKDHYLYDTNIEKYLQKTPHTIPLLKVTYVFGTPMGNSKIDFSNENDRDKIFESFTSLANVFYQTQFCSTTLVDIKNNNKSFTTAIKTRVISYLADINKLIKDNKGKFINKLRIIYYNKEYYNLIPIKKPEILKTIEKILENTVYIFGGAGILETESKIDDLKKLILKKTHGLTKQIIVFDGGDENIDIPLNIETEIISIEKEKSGVTKYLPDDVLFRIIEKTTTVSTTDTKKLYLMANGCEIIPYRFKADYNSKEISYYDVTELPVIFEYVLLDRIYIINDAINNEDVEVVTSFTSPSTGSSTVPTTATTSSTTSTIIGNCPIAFKTGKPDILGIYDPTIEIKNGATVYKKRRFKNDKENDVKLEYSSDKKWTFITDKTEIKSDKTTAGLPHSTEWNGVNNVNKIYTFLDSDTSTGLYPLTDNIAKIAFEFADMADNLQDNKTTYNDKTRIEGDQFIDRDDCISFGVAYYENGDIYKGTFEKKLRVGKGVLFYANGDIYCGEWNNNHIEGKGIYNWTDGQLYTGEWKGDFMNGKGKITLSNGDSYEGGWEKSKKNGIGIYTWANGNSYHATWANDQRDGNGKFVPKGEDAKKINFHEIWTNGKLTGI